MCSIYTKNIDINEHWRQRRFKNKIGGVIPSTAMMMSASEHCISVRNGITSSIIIILSRLLTSRLMHSSALTRVYRIHIKLHDNTAFKHFNDIYLCVRPFKNMSRLKGRDGVRWGVTKCDRGGGGSSATCDVTLVKYFYNTFYRNLQPVRPWLSKRSFIVNYENCSLKCLKCIWWWMDAFMHISV